MSALAKGSKNLPVRGLERRVELAVGAAEVGGRADSGELAWPVRGTRGGGERSGVKVDLWSVLWSG